ncbi:hypothetical protein GCM10010178_14370 [Lentzea flava]|uniref:Uncharacterized protein n=2 Tax=Lentzea flava TaxID=103732 RepID=A0ABQ2UD00_9PSEU|nr:hypothetical protein [Lentzea flava]GGU23365.1 hypothetical protein GCM10010178_14370 [Lentzea flava]
MVGESVVPHVDRGGAPVFADVVAADLDWVRAEFDAIVAANFLESAPPPRRHPREHPRHPAPPIGMTGPSGRESGDLAGTARRVGARERSPPRPAYAAIDPWI